MTRDHAMTREERNARTKKRLEENPFLAELYRKSRRRYRERNREQIAAKKREYNSRPDVKARERARMAARRAAMTPEQREKQREYNRLYWETHRAEMQARFKAWRKTPHGMAVIEEIHRLQRERFRNDEEYAAKIRAQQRENYHRTKNTPKVRARLDAANRAALLKHWEEVVAGGRERIAKYLKLARKNNRAAFVRWYSARLIDRTHGLGHIVQKADEEVAR